MKFPTASTCALALALLSGAALAQGAKKTAPAAAAPAAPVQDRADIDRQQIIGNRELPKVLYIVPWKKPLPGDPAAACSTRRSRPSTATYSAARSATTRSSRPDPMPPLRRRAEPRIKPESLHRSHP